MPSLLGEAHDVDDLHGMDLAERAGRHREVLADHGDQAAVDIAGADHHAVARHGLSRHVEMLGSMMRVNAGFLERVRLAERFDAFARIHQALFPTGGQLLMSAPGADRRPAFAQLLDEFPIKAHGRPSPPTASCYRTFQQMFGGSRCGNAHSLFLMLQNRA